MQHSWLPYLWLFWLFGFFQKWFVVPIEPVEFTLALCTMAVFLPLYFNGYWRTGHRLLVTVAGCLLIGIVWLPYNTGAMPFFGYGSAFVGRAARPRQAFMYLAGIVLLVASESLLLGMPPDFLLFAAKVSVASDARLLARRKASRRDGAVGHVLPRVRLDGRGCPKWPLREPCWG